MTLPLISKPLTAAQLRARVLEQLALMNGHAPGMTGKKQAADE